MEGHCQGVSAGYHTLSLYLASCPWGVGHLDVNTGWNSCRNRVIINELRKETNIGAGQKAVVIILLNSSIHNNFLQIKVIKLMSVEIPRAVSNWSNGIPKYPEGRAPYLELSSKKKTLVGFEPKNYNPCFKEGDCLFPV